MKIAGVEAARDPPAGLVQQDGLFPYRPITRKGPTVKAQLRGGRIDAALVRRCTAGGGEVLGALVADIVFRRLQAVPIGSDFNAPGLYRNQFMTDAAGPGLGQ